MSADNGNLDLKGQRDSDPDLPGLNQLADEQRATFRPSRTAADSRVALGPGDLLDSKFRIVRELGVGTVTRVFAASSTGSEKLVAIKALHETSAVPPRLWIDLQRNCQLRHANIETWHEVSVSNTGIHYIVAEYLEGVSLKELLASVDRFDAPEIVVPVLNDVLNALEAAHQMGVVHGGVRPSNIILVENKNDFRAVITDFGLANLDLNLRRAATCDSERLNYLSPEQMKNSAFSASSDIFALGLITYEMLSGRLPLKILTRTSSSSIEPISDTVSDTRPEIVGIQWLDHWLQQAIEEDPDWRIPDIKEFRDGVNAWIELLERSSSTSITEIASGLPIDPEGSVRPIAVPIKNQPAISAASSEPQSLSKPYREGNQSRDTNSSIGEHSADPIPTGSKLLKKPHKRSTAGASRHGELKETIRDLISIKNRHLAIEQDCESWTHDDRSDDEYIELSINQVIAVVAGLLTLLLALAAILIFFSRTG